MLDQIIGPLRSAGSVQIAGRRDEFEAIGRNPARHQSRILDVAGTNDDVVSGVDNIDKTIVDIDLQLHVGVFALEFGQRGNRYR